VYADIRGLDGIELVANGRSWGGKIENFIYLNIERETDVVAHQLKAGIRPQMMHVVSGSGVELSTHKTSYPCSTGRSQRCDPMNPAPPVTRTRRSVNMSEPSGSSRPRVEIFFVSFA